MLLCNLATSASAFLTSPIFCVFLSELTLWNGPFNDGEVGRKAFLSDGAVSVDCQCQDAGVGDYPPRGVLPTVPPDVWTDWRQEAKGNKSTNIVIQVRLGLTQYL